jgi:hypothetical protein
MTIRSKILDYFRSIKWDNNIKIINKKELENLFPKHIDKFKDLMEDRFGFHVYLSSDRFYIKKYKVCKRCLSEFWSNDRYYCPNCIKGEKEKEIISKSEINCRKDKFIYNMY